MVGQDSDLGWAEGWTKWLSSWNGIGLSETTLHFSSTIGGDILLCSHSIHFNRMSYNHGYMSLM